MTFDEAIRFFNSGYDMAKQLDISHSNVFRWKKQKFIPVKQQLKINQVTGANLPIDLDKEAMEKRVKGKE